MTARRIYEAGKLLEGKTSKGTWPIRIITEGEGSSGVYSRELLESYKDVFANRAMFGNHPKDPNKPWERSPFEIRAKLGPTVEYKVVDGVAGIYGEAEVDDEVDRWLEKFGDIVGVSIYASGDGREENGKWIVESFDGSDPYTSVDFVVAAGRGGGVERVSEAYRALIESSTAPADADTQGRENRTMDEATKAFIESLFSKQADEFNKSIEALEEKIDNAVTLVESVKEAQPERVEAVDAAGELAKAVATEKLAPGSVTRVLESVKGGASIEDAVKTEKALIEEVLGEAGKGHSEGYVVPGEDKKFSLTTLAGVK